jgi:ABC-type polysaccharide/polyol phosphate export permease
MSEPRTLRQVVKDVRRYRDLLINLTQRELRARYRRSVLGWAWSFLQPAMMTAVYAIVLGKFLDVPRPTGDPSGVTIFVIFLLAGVLPWNFFAASLGTSMGAVAGAGGLITRIWFPRELLPMASIFALYTSFLIELGVLTLFVSALTQQMMIQYLPFALVISMIQLMFTAGISFWLAACNVRYKDVEYLTGALLLAYFYMTPIIYPQQVISTEKVWRFPFTWLDLVLANPMARFAMAYRNVFYDFRMPGLNTMLWLTGWSVAVFYLGLRFYLRRADRFAELM